LPVRGSFWNGRFRGGWSSTRAGRGNPARHKDLWRRRVASGREHRGGAAQWSAWLLCAWPSGSRPRRSRRPLSSSIAKTRLQFFP